MIFSCKRGNKIPRTRGVTGSTRRILGGGTTRGIFSLLCRKNSGKFVRKNKTRVRGLRNRRALFVDGAALSEGRQVPCAPQNLSKLSENFPRRSPAWLLRPEGRRDAFPERRDSAHNSRFGSSIL